MATDADVSEEIAQLERYLDRAVEEVFSTMIGVGCSRTSSPHPTDGIMIAALIGLAGAMSGTLVLQTEGPAAMRVSELMTGLAPTEVDPTVRDAMGEMANMIAGAWKGYDPQLSSACLLSTPTIVVGRRYELFSRRSVIRIDRVYAFESFLCTISLACERAA
jgi:chemotaxis protein CheX